MERENLGSLGKKKKKSPSQNSAFFLGLLGFAPWNLSGRQFRSFPQILPGFLVSLGYPGIPYSQHSAFPGISSLKSPRIPLFFPKFPNFFWGGRGLVASPLFPKFFLHSLGYPGILYSQKSPFSWDYLDLLLKISQESSFPKFPLLLRFLLLKFQEVFLGFFFFFPFSPLKYSQESFGYSQSKHPTEAFPFFHTIPMAGAHSREFGSQDFYGGRGGEGARSRDFLPESLLFSILQSRLFSGVFLGVLGFFFFVLPGKIIGSSPKDRSEFQRDGAGSGLGAAPPLDLGESGMGFGIQVGIWDGRIRDGIRDGIWNLGWKNLGWNLEFGMEESGMESGIQAGIWDGRIRAGIWNLGWKNPGFGLQAGIWDGRIQAGIWNLGWMNPGWNPGSRPDFGLEESRECGADPTLRNPQNPSGLRQFPAALLGRSRGSGFLKNLGKSQERTSLTPKFHLLFQEELIPAEIPEFGAVSPPPAEKSAGIFPGDPKKFPAPTLVGLPPPLFPANPDPSSEFRAGNGQNSAGAGSRTSGRAGHGSRSEFPEFGTGIESRTLALPPNLFPVFFFSFGVFFFMEATLEFLECRAVGEGGGGGRKSGIPGNFGVGFSSWKTPG
ncbi:uncharacterized protein LOC116435836 isoform X2 [Corvus moneduloides]|uniref:uncharacterized protein LOC116435836 isoform X2 n=1 Tax=Corvus moneduloides TaxID=1196302 RepID=UPI001363F810|nr:uncharacterized protein LOC116435836 isoform X2 [Corvus moneduloides]